MNIFTEPFAEIGAGQEVARHFFRVGGASGTIAKTISAYDKSFSDNIYGEESDGRYVTETRLKKMLDREMNLLEDRISRKEHPNKLFFTKVLILLLLITLKNLRDMDGWGLDFKLPRKNPTVKLCFMFDFIKQKQDLHFDGLVKLYKKANQPAVKSDPKKLLKYLYDHIDNDHIDTDSIEIDTINFSGPLFKKVDNSLMSLQLIKNEMTDAVMFGPDGKNVLPARVLYKKNILALRGSFRPVTKVNIDMFEKSYEIFSKENNVDEENTEVIFEITLSNLRAAGEIDEKDFMDRAKLLCSLGHSVMISNFKEYYKLVDYFSNYTTSQLALSMGVNSFVEIFNEEYYTDLSGGILEAFGKLFYNNLKEIKKTNNKSLK